MEFELADLLFSYCLKEHDSEKGQYTLYRRKEHSHLITDLSTSEKAWKNNFFFISDDCLGNKEGEPQVPFAWQKAGNSHNIVIFSCCCFTETYYFPFAGFRELLNSPHSCERTEKILKIKSTL